MEITETEAVKKNPSDKILSRGLDQRLHSNDSLYYGTQTTHYCHGESLAVYGGRLGKQENDSGQDSFLLKKPLVTPGNGSFL